MAGDVPLIPPLRSEAEGWSNNLFPPLRSEASANGTRSALIGDWQPMPGPGQGAARCGWHVRKPDPMARKVLRALTRRTHGARRACVCVVLVGVFG